MSKKSVIEREKKRLFMQKKYKSLRRFIKGKIKNSKSIEEKLFYSSLIQRIPRNSSKTKSLCLVKKLILYKKYDSYNYKSVF